MFYNICSILVPVHNQTALRAVMHPFSKSLRNPAAAAGAILRRVLSVDSLDLIAPEHYTLVGSESNKRTPSGIQDGFSQMGISDHPGDIQFLKSDG
jgi:hypothetical protein